MEHYVNYKTSVEKNYIWKTKKKEDDAIPEWTIAFFWNIVKISLFLLCWAETWS